MNEKIEPNVRQLRVVVEADDYDAALAFYRDALGLVETAAFSGDGDERVAILEAGRATLEIASPAQVDMIDRIEVGDRVSPHIRLAFEVDDASAMVATLTSSGADLIAGPVETPWRSSNARLAAPAGVQLTIFQEFASASERLATDGFGENEPSTDSEA